MIKTELDIVYISKGKRFLTREEAEKHEHKKEKPKISDGWFFGSKDAEQE